MGISYAAILPGAAFTLLGLVMAGPLLGLITPEVAERFGFRPVTDA